MAAKNFNANKILRGSFGKCWLNEQRMANVKSCEAKLALNYEDLFVNGDLGQKSRFMSYSGSGTMTLHKYDSYILNLYNKGVSSGDLPELKLVITLDDPSGYGAQRVALYDVQITELTLGQFENNTVLEEEVPFTFGGYEFLDLI